MVSASLGSLKGPTCTWNRASPGTLLTKTGYCFLRSADTRISASSCLETAATWTIYGAPKAFFVSVAGEEVLAVVVEVVAVELTGGGVGWVSTRLVAGAP